jgi:hypothetical protein
LLREIKVGDRGVKKISGNRLGKIGNYQGAQFWLPVFEFLNIQFVTGYIYIYIYIQI